MAVVVVINPEQTDPFVHLKNILIRPGKVLERIGAILEAGSQDAFLEQAFGDFRWPGRYPNQADPHINVAGALGDFAKGRSEPKSRRFDRRPALRDTGALLGSIRSQVVSDEVVEVGSTLPYAAMHQFGGTSSIPIDKATKQRIVKWLLKPAGEPHRGNLSPLLTKDTLDTEVVQRPFLGVTDEMETDIHDTVETMIAGAAGGNS